MTGKSPDVRWMLEIVCVGLMVWHVLSNNVRSKSASPFPRIEDTSRDLLLLVPKELLFILLGFSKGLPRPNGDFELISPRTQGESKKAWNEENCLGSVDWICTVQVYTDNVLVSIPSLTLSNDAKSVICSYTGRRVFALRCIAEWVHFCCRCTSVCRAKTSSHRNAR